MVLNTCNEVNKKSCDAKSDHEGAPYQVLQFVDGPEQVLSANSEYWNNVVGSGGAGMRGNKPERRHGDQVVLEALFEVRSRDLSLRFMEPVESAREGGIR